MNIFMKYYCIILALTFIAIAVALVLDYIDRLWAGRIRTETKIYNRRMRNIRMNNHNELNDAELMLAIINTPDDELVEVEDWD